MYVHIAWLHSPPPRQMLLSAVAFGFARALVCFVEIGGSLATVALLAQSHAEAEAEAAPGSHV